VVLIAVRIVSRPNLLTDRASNASAGIADEIKWLGGIYPLIMC
jgi:hypothetical protein